MEIVHQGLSEYRTIAYSLQTKDEECNHREWFTKVVIVWASLEGDQLKSCCTNPDWDSN
jgi:hypothetical protein